MNNWTSPAALMLCAGLLIAGAQAQKAPSKTTTTIAGVDANKNGVRDDVERDLRAKYSGALFKQSIKVARNFQSLLVLASRLPKTPSSNEIQKISDTTTALFSSETCIYNSAGFDKMKEVGDFIEARTMNTKERIRAYQRINAHLSGFAFDDQTTRCRK